MYNGGMLNPLAAGLCSQIDYYIQSAAKYTKFAKAAQFNDPMVHDVWYNPSDSTVIVRRKYASEGDTLPTLTKIKTAAIETAPIQDHWCGLRLATGEQYFTDARAIANTMMGCPKTASTTAQKIYSLLGWDDRYYPTNPVAAMLATGVLGAGLGYGGATLASTFLPNTWDKKKFRRSGLLFGGAIGAAPGAAEVMKSLLIGQPVLDGSHMTREFKEDQLKESNYGLPYTSTPRISGEDLMKMTWQHPLVSQQMTPGQQALFSGAVQGATAISGSPFFTPTDMARLTAGMGSGYAMGLVAGKVLGALTGMPQSAQKTLANTGMYAGTLKAVLPLLYNGR